jgi:hypothetical protein
LFQHASQLIAFTVAGKELCNICYYVYGAVPIGGAQPMTDLPPCVGASLIIPADLYWSLVRVLGGKQHA